MSIGEADIQPVVTVGAPAGLRERASFVVMVTGNIFNLLWLTALSPVLAIIGDHFSNRPDAEAITGFFGTGASGPLVAQLMITLVGFGFIVGGPLTGWLADRIGVRPLLVGALALYAVTGATGLKSDDPATLLFARFVLGIAASGIGASVFAMIAQRYQGEARAKILGLQGAILSASGIVSLVAAGGLAEIGGWRGPFSLFLLAVPMLGLVLFSAPVASRASAAQGAKAAAKGALLRQWPYYVMMVPMSIASYMTAAHLSFVLAGDGMVNPLIQSVVMAASMILNIVGSAYYARINARIGRRWVFVMILGFFAAADLLIGLIPNAVGSSIGCWVAGIAGGLMTPFFVNVILDRTPTQVHGRAVGLMYTTGFIGNFLNPFLITPLRTHIGNHPTFAAVGAAIAVAALVQAMTKRSPVA